MNRGLQRAKTLQSFLAIKNSKGAQNFVQQLIPAQFQL